MKPTLEELLAQHRRCEEWTRVPGEGNSRRVGCACGWWGERRIEPVTELGSLPASFLELFDVEYEAHLASVLTTKSDIVERLIQRLESHGESCCQLDARDRKAIEDAKGTAMNNMRPATLPWYIVEVPADESELRINPSLDTPEPGEKVAHLDLHYKALPVMVERNEPGVFMGSVDAQAEPECYAIACIVGMSPEHAAYMLEAVNNYRRGVSRKPSEEAIEAGIAQLDEVFGEDAKAAPTLPAMPSEEAKVAAYFKMTGRRDGSILGSDARRSKGWARMERMLKAAYAVDGVSRERSAPSIKLPRATLPVRWSEEALGAAKNAIHVALNMNDWVIRDGTYPGDLAKKALAAAYARDGASRKPSATPISDDDQAEINTLPEGAACSRFVLANNGKCYRCGRHLPEHSHTAWPSESRRTE